MATVEHGSVVKWMPGNGASTGIVFSQQRGPLTGAVSVMWSTASRGQSIRGGCIFTETPVEELVVVGKVQNAPYCANGRWVRPFSRDLAKRLAALTARHLASPVSSSRQVLRDLKLERMDSVKRRGRYKVSFNCPACGSGFNTRHGDGSRTCGACGHEYEVRGH